MSKKIIAIFMTFAILFTMCGVVSADMKNVKLPDLGRIQESNLIPEMIGSSQVTLASNENSEETAEALVADEIKLDGKFYIPMYNFDDVDIDTPYYQYIMFAKFLGILDVKEDNKFKPGDVLTENELEDALNVISMRDLYDDTDTVDKNINFTGQKITLQSLILRIWIEDGKQICCDTNFDFDNAKTYFTNRGILKESEVADLSNGNITRGQAAYILTNYHLSLFGFDKTELDNLNKNKVIKASGDGNSLNTDINTHSSVNIHKETGEVGMNSSASTNPTTMKKFKIAYSKLDQKSKTVKILAYINCPRGKIPIRCEIDVFDLAQNHHIIVVNNSNKEVYELARLSNDYKISVGDKEICISDNNSTIQSTCFFKIQASNNNNKVTVTSSDNNRTEKLEIRLPEGYGIISQGIILNYEEEVEKIPPKVLETSIVIILDENTLLSGLSASISTNDIRIIQNNYNNYNITYNSNGLNTTEFRSKITISYFWNNRPCGDIDYNNIVDKNDLFLIQKYENGEISLTVEQIESYNRFINIEWDNKNNCSYIATYNTGERRTISITKSANNDNSSALIHMYLFWERISSTENYNEQTSNLGNEKSTNNVTTTQVTYDMNGGQPVDDRIVTNTTISSNKMCMTVPENMYEKSDKYFIGYTLQVTTRSTGRLPKITYWYCLNSAGEMTLRTDGLLQNSTSYSKKLFRPGSVIYNIDFGKYSAFKFIAEYSDFDYRILDYNSVEVSGYKGNNTDIVIPDTLFEKKVIGIGENAFANCSNLKSIFLTVKNTTFEDVPTSHWAYEAICAAQSLNITSGYSNNEFGIHKNTSIEEFNSLIKNINRGNTTKYDCYAGNQQDLISRNYVVTSIYRDYGSPNISYFNVDRYLSQFRDREEITNIDNGQYSKYGDGEKAWAWCIKNKIIYGTYYDDSTTLYLEPKINIPLEQAVAIVLRYYFVRAGVDNDKVQIRITN